MPHPAQHPSNMWTTYISQHGMITAMKFYMAIKRDERKIFYSVDHAKLSPSSIIWYRCKLVLFTLPFPLPWPKFCDRNADARSVCGS